MLLFLESLPCNASLSLLEEREGGWLYPQAAPPYLFSIYKVVAHLPLVRENSGQEVLTGLLSFLLVVLFFIFFLLFSIRFLDAMSCYVTRNVTRKLLVVEMVM
jgi:hypothetical protein